ncbi:MAG: DUF1501 domain-containing protein [Bacteroidales bacterium]|nr:DUF1501 domain-containing protein [Bacteroidales bacterium]
MIHPAHPQFSRRTAIQAGTVGLLGLGLAELAFLREARATDAFHREKIQPKKAVIFIFLSGGLAQHESFDPKPDAPEAIRGEFGTIPTRIPGVRITEHLPKLAARSHQWSMIRSYTHRTNDHSLGHHIVLTGRSDTPTGFNPSQPQPSDYPSIAAMAGVTTQPRNNLPPAVVLPEKLVHRTGRIIPGQFAGPLGRINDPWFLEASPFAANAYGAFPEYEFDHQQRAYTSARSGFVMPNLNLPEGVDPLRFDQRLDILRKIDTQRRGLDAAAAGLDKSRQNAINLLTNPQVRSAFDIRQAPSADITRYGNNAFGWSLLMAARLVEAGVNLVQVNLGNNETWDTHGNAFPHLKEKLLPPTDHAVSALLDDLNERGLLEKTLIVMAGEFGRTPRISQLKQFYKGAGRDHWGAVQSVFLAGGGVQGGRVIGSSDKIGGHPTADPQTPEALAATIYDTLGLPANMAWSDAENRPHSVYSGEPIRGLF